MRVGIIILPTDRWSDQARRWQQAEAYGFDHGWTYDHLTWDPLAGMPWGATIPTLVAAATVTSTLPLGTWVASPNYRHPVTLARELAALDDVSGGRAVLGIGAGGPAPMPGCWGTATCRRPTAQPASRSSSGCSTRC
jgi:alkanesulfonate monooxygenase SsuD/methylene tetrahydromethanopterin reductase-like flavin-dependent oxidoreductase (luciferase family)